MSRYSGKKGRVMISPTANGSAVTVVGLSQWSLDLTKDKFDATAFDDGSKRVTVGFPNGAGRFQGWLESGDHTIFDAADLEVSVNTYLYPDHSNMPSVYFYGLFWVDASIDVGVGKTNSVAGTLGADSVVGRNWA